MKYIVSVKDGIYLSTSRNSKKHLRNHGGSICKVYQFGSNKLVSAAIKDETGIHNIYIEKE